jgi:hypothetical protein
VQKNSFALNSQIKIFKQKHNELKITKKLLQKEEESFFLLCFEATNRAKKGTFAKG